MVKKIHVCGREISLYLPAQFDGTAVWCHGASAAVWDAMGETNAALLNVENVDWNGELSPWAAEKVFRSGDDFRGGADAYLNELVSALIPAAEPELPGAVTCRCIAGYSLAGLFAVYAAFRCDAFRRIASASGSMWFDGFAAFAEKTPVCRLPEKIWFSLGDRESDTRNVRMAAVGRDTQTVAEIFRRRGAQTQFTWNSGGHFSEPDRRLADGIRWITSDPATSISYKNKGDSL